MEKDNSSTDFEYCLSNWEDDSSDNAVDRVELYIHSWTKRTLKLLGLFGRHFVTTKRKCNEEIQSSHSTCITEYNIDYFTVLELYTHGDLLEVILNSIMKEFEAKGKLNWEDLTNWSSCTHLTGHEKVLHFIQFCLFSGNVSTCIFSKLNNYYFYLNKPCCGLWSKKLKMSQRTLLFIILCLIEAFGDLEDGPIRQLWKKYFLKFHRSFHLNDIFNVDSFKLVFNDLNLADCSTNEQVELKIGNVNNELFTGSHGSASPHNSIVSSAEDALLYENFDHIFASNFDNVATTDADLSTKQSSNAQEFDILQKENPILEGADESTHTSNTQLCAFDDLTFEPVDLKEGFHNHDNIPKTSLNHCGELDSLLDNDFFANTWSSNENVCQTSLLGTD